jgi:hypothetical protein
VPDGDWPLDSQGGEQLVNLNADVVERRGRAATLAVRGQVDPDAPYGAGEALDDRPPGAAVERQAVEEEDGERRARLGSRVRASPRCDATARRRRASSGKIRHVVDPNALERMLERLSPHLDAKRS